MSIRQDVFIKEVFPGGDVDYSPPHWRDMLDKHNARKGKVEHDAENIKDSLIKEDEVGIKHPILGTSIKLSDDGCIDIFAGEHLGIRLDPNTESANIFADNINFFGKNVNFRTKPRGFVWNGHSFNPDMYAKEEAVKPMIKSDSRVQYSEGMLDILVGLGLPVDKE